MKLVNLFRRPTAGNHLPVVVVFAGGMGTQIIQAAVYYSLKEEGHTVYGDTSYFDRAQKLAVVGNAGELTHWGWQLDHFGLTPASFDSPPSGLNKRNSDILPDGERMLMLGLKALTRPEIQARFGMPDGIIDLFPGVAAGHFLCMHLRRGDYVNVASHLVTDEEFLLLSRKFSGLMDRAVALSDSPIGPEFRGGMSSCFREVFFLDNIGAFASHCIMRHARVLLCSNSTFSLTAALLNPDLLAIVPRKWYGDDQSHLETPIHADCLFEIMKNGRI